jgi:hypothetical protein
MILKLFRLIPNDWVCFFPDCYLTHRRSPSYEVEKMEMSGTEGLFELECKKDL